MVLNRTVSELATSWIALNRQFPHLSNELHFLAHNELLASFHEFLRRFMHGSKTLARNPDTVYSRFGAPNEKLVLPRDHTMININASLRRLHLILLSWFLRVLLGLRTPSWSTVPILFNYLMPGLQFQFFSTIWCQSFITRIYAGEEKRPFGSGYNSCLPGCSSNGGGLCQISRNSWQCIFCS